MWTEFHDMHSGGGQKLAWSRIYIEAPRAEAELIFQNRFGRNPNRVTCTCCGEDYSIDEHESLQQATAYSRGCAYRDGQYLEQPSDRPSFHKNYVPFETWLKEHPTYTPKSLLDTPTAHVVYAQDIKPEERQGELIPEGYVWAGD